MTIDINEFNSFLMDFAETIRQTNFSIFPLDLKTVNNIMGKVLMYVYHRIAELFTYNVATYSAVEENSTLLNVNITEVESI